jgi:hypothetical protein
VIASARPIDGRDALTSSKPLPKGTEPSGIDVAELRTRFNGLRGDADTLVADLATAVTNAGAAGAGASQLAALRAVLRRAADAGLPFAFPAGADDTLIAQGKASGTALAALRDRAAALNTASQAATLRPPQITNGEQAVLAAPRYVEGRLDWYAFDAAPAATRLYPPAGAAEAPPRAETLSFVPGLVVTDVFGDRTVIPPANAETGAAVQRWSMFSVTGESDDDWGGRYFWLPASLTSVDSSAPLEAVSLARDEMANLAWAVEDVVPDGVGKGIETRLLIPPEPLPPPTIAGVRYTLGTTVPENWIPFVPVHLPGSIGRNSALIKQHVLD